ncbi:MAG: primase [Gaiellales bacterium]|jgi:DNA primase|nr:primase [Gaiellales bacterium]
MTRIRHESVEAVKEAVDMIDLVSGRTQLKRSGVEWRGRCPFHEERTASFWVDPVKKVYHCFGCGVGGDAIGFVTETEALDFSASVEWLADRYGVELEYEESSPEADRRRAQRDRLLQLLDTTAAFYQRFLWEAAEAEPARTYLAGRGISRESADRFRIGYASSGGDRLRRAALGKGFTPAEIEQAGLAARGGDRFRDRLLFPLSDARGRVRGFGARQMPGGRPPKYLNTSDGPVFRKSEILYGLDLARRAIAQAGFAIVVEGYTDVVMLHQAGIDRAVASMGTALTEGQVGELRRLCSTVYLAFDADAAGQEASLRGMEMALAKGLSVRVVTLPGGRDPADVAADDPSVLERSLAEAVGYLTYRVRRVLDSSGSRDERYQQATAILSAAAPSVERDDLVKLVAGRLELSEDLTARLTAGPVSATGAGPAPVRKVRLSSRERDERLFLGLCLAFPERGLNLLCSLDVAHFSEPSRWEAATVVRRQLSGELAPEEERRWAPLIAELTALASQEATSPAVLEELFWKLRLRQTEDELKALQQNADLSLSQQQRLQELQELRLSILETIRSL